MWTEAAWARCYGLTAPDPACLVGATSSSRTLGPRGPGTMPSEVTVRVKVLVVMMDASPLLTIALAVVMIVMMGGMVLGAAWAFLRRRRQGSRR
jgi:hypothetical protein